MPSAAENLEVIESTLKASLSQGKQLDQNVASAAQRVLLHNIEFVPSTKPHSVQFSSLKSKYVLLQPGNSSLGKKLSKAAGEQGDSANTVSLGRSKDHADDAMNGPGSSGDSHMGDSLPSPRVVIYPPERVKLDWRQTPRIGAGLVNLGNTCFFNSTLQCLTYTAPLFNYCFSEEHPNTCKQQNFCLMCELRRHIRSCFQNSGHAFKPQMMLQKLRLIAKHMRWGRQEDAHEFLRHLVDGLQRACLTGFAKLDKFSKETTVINQIFGGFLRSQVQCMRCSARSNTYDPFMDLSLDIKQSNSLEDALAKFVKAETLDSDNAYKCEKCQQKVPAKKRFSIHQAPNVLTLQLNRFDFHRSAGKINRFIMFPEKLNIRPYMSQRQGEPIHYNLYGVLIHSGFNCNSGHYYCYVKAPNKNWYLMNDSLVQTIPASRVFQAEAYLLFYSRAVPVNSQSQNKAPHVGPNSNGLVTANKFVGMNGSHSKLVHNPQPTPVKTGNDVGVAVSRQLVSPSTAGPGVPSTSTAGPASSLPQKHKKISFGIGTPKPFQPAQQQNNVQHTQKDSDATNGPSNPRIVMQIKNGKVTTIEKSPDGKSKVVKGGQRRPSTLVPYAADSDSSDDEPSGGSKASEKNGQHVKDSGKENRVTETLSKLTQGPSSSAVTNSPKKDKSGQGEGSQKMKAVSTDVKPDGFDSLKARRDLTLKLNRDNNSVARKISIDVMSPSRVNATSSWTVQTQDSAPSPSLASLSSNNSNHSNHSINSTTEWTVQDNVPTPTVDRKLHPAGWTITDSPAATSVEKTDSVKREAEKGGVVKAKLHGKSERNQTMSDSSHISRVVVTESGDAGQTCARTFAEKVAKEKHSAVSFRGDADGSNFSSAHVSDKHGSHTGFQRNFSYSVQCSSVKELPKADHTHCVKDKTSEERVNGHAVSYSDKQPLLSQDDSPDHKVRKKHKKKKHKRDKEQEHSSVRYQPLQESFSSAAETPTRHKHKKKKRKSHDLGDSDSERRDKRRKDRDGSDSDHRGKRHRDRQEESNDGVSAKKKRKLESSDSEEYMWEERTKETLAAEQQQVHKAKANENTVPSLSWDLHIRDSLGHGRQDKDSSQAQPVKVVWDGTRQSSVLDELERRPAVMSWNGGRSQADIDAEKERERRQRKTWSERYEEDIDRGKVKKVKSKLHDDNHNAFNPFQSFENDKKQDKEKWKDGHDSHHKQYTSPLLNRFHSDQGPYRHGNWYNRDGYNRSNGHGGHYGKNRNHSFGHQNHQKRY